MFYGMMRVKNEAKRIGRATKSLFPACDICYVFDDNSTDDTAEIVQNTAGCVYIHSPFTLHGLDESRDKTYLLREIERRMLLDKDDWIVCIDGDEEICAEDLERMTQVHPRNVSYSLQILTLYDSPKQIRVDPPYDRLYRPSMFRVIKPGMVFKSNAQHGGGLHCSNVPADIGFGVTLHDPPVRVKHYGYLHQADREKKYKFYVEHDPGHEDWYKTECLREPVLVPLPDGL